MVYITKMTQSEPRTLGTSVSSVDHAQDNQDHVSIFEPWEKGPYLLLASIESPIHSRSVWSFL